MVQIAGINPIRNRRLTPARESASIVATRPMHLANEAAKREPTAMPPGPCKTARRIRRWPFHPVIPRWSSGRPTFASPCHRPHTLKSTTSSPCHHCTGAVWCSTGSCNVCPRPALLGFIWLLPRSCSCSLGRLTHCQFPCHCPHTLNPMPLPSHPQSHAIALTPSIPCHCPHTLNPMPLPSHPQSHAIVLTPSIPCHCPHILQSPHTQHVYQVH